MYASFWARGNHCIDEGTCNDGQSGMMAILAAYTMAILVRYRGKFRRCRQVSGSSAVDIHTPTDTYTHNHIGTHTHTQREREIKRKGGGRERKTEHAHTHTHKKEQHIHVGGTHGKCSGLQVPQCAAQSILQLHRLLSIP